MVITVDGFSGCGKTTFCQRLANAINYTFVSSGTIYRLYAFLALKHGIENVSMDFSQIKIERNGDVCYQDQNINEALRSPDVGKYTSQLAQNSEIREQINNYLLELCGDGNFVLDGRDLGVAVFPNALIKVFMYGSIEYRVNNWERGYIKRNGKPNPEEKQKVYLDLFERDKNDAERGVSPVRPAQDAIIFKIDDISYDDMLDVVIKKYQEIMK